jgi:hypothetical protein
MANDGCFLDFRPKTAASESRGPLDGFCGLSGKERRWSFPDLEAFTGFGENHQVREEVSVTVDM